MESAARLFAFAAAALLALAPGVWGQTTPVFTTLHRFSGTVGVYPNALVQGNDGNFYGTTDAGGDSNYGTVFSITPAGVATSLHSFTGADGAHPVAALVQGGDGNFYGTTGGGGTDDAGHGVPDHPGRRIHQFALLYQYRWGGTLRRADPGQ